MSAVRSCYRPPKRKHHVIRSVVLFSCLFPFSLRSYNLLHPRSRSFARRFAPSNDVRCGTSSILLSPTIMKTSCDLLHGVFFLAFFLFSLRSYNLLHPRSRSFARRFAPSNDVRCGTSSILLSPTKRKHHVIRSVVLFSCHFLFSLRSYNLLHPRLTTFCASLCSFKMCSLRNQFDPVIAHQSEKFHVLRAVGFFVAFPFSLICHSPCP